MIPENMAIVGSSSSILEANNGTLIDAYEYVARFNNATVNRLYEKNVGKRWNVWVTSFYLDVVDPFKTFDYVFCPLPLNDKRWNTRYKRNEKLIKKYNPIYIPTNYFEELLQHVKNPSTGLAFLYWRYRQFSKLDPESIFGFSWFRGKLHYYNGQTRTTHDGELEEGVFFSMLWDELNADKHSIDSAQSTDIRCDDVPEEEPELVEEIELECSLLPPTCDPFSESFNVPIPEGGESIFYSEDYQFCDQEPEQKPKRGRKKKSTDNQD
jgi:hypothetical protein